MSGSNVTLRTFCFLSVGTGMFLIVISSSVEGGNGRCVWIDVRVVDDDSDVICVGGDHSRNGRAVVYEEIEDATGDDRALKDTAVDYFGRGCCREIEKSCLPSTKGREQSLNPLGVKGKAEKFVDEGQVMRRIK